MAGVQLSFAAQLDGRDARDALGRFRTREITNAEIKSVNRRLATELRGYAVEELQKSIVRRGVSTGRLVRATAAEGNIYQAGNIFSTASWGVGVASFLDQSQAKYWRTIEDGSAAIWRHPFVGMKIWPWANLTGKVGQSGRLAWGGTIRRLPESGFKNLYQAGPPWGAADGKFRGIRPYWGQRAQNWVVRGKKLRELGYGPLVVSKEIAPHHYYEKAYEQMSSEITRTYTGLVNRLEL